MASTNNDIQNIFTNTLAPTDVRKFTLFRGVTDFTQLEQFDLYETGYSFLVLLKIPAFLTELGNHNTNAGWGYDALIKNYRHILEYEFKGAQGIEDIQSDTSPLSNGISELNMITRVNEQSASQFQMNYFERSGSVITKVHELYLRGIKDPRTQVKRYNGLLRAPLTNKLSGSTGESNAQSNYIDQKGFHQEIFHFMLIVTDNTALHVEKAYILASCQPTAANTSIYNVTRNEIGFSEMSLNFNGFPIPGRIVNEKATKLLAYINEHTCFDEMEFGYNILLDNSSGDWASSVGNNADNSASSVLSDGTYKGGAGAAQNDF